MKRLAALAALAIAGCGQTSPDLFEVSRSGKDPSANIRLVVNDGGTVSCNGKPSKALPGDELLTARQLARDLEAQAALSIELPAAKNSLRRYVVRTQAGRVAFSDTSAGKPHAFDQLIAFTQNVIEDVCR